MSENYKIVTDVDGKKWIEIGCECCGETFAIKLPRFCKSKCYGKWLEENKPTNHGKKKNKEN